MEKLNDRIELFLSSGDGDGWGYGSGSGTECGSGYGWGSGSGDGTASGFGTECGSGYGWGYDGWGYGSGSGTEYGSGYGWGSGSGDGTASGFGDGAGYGDGVSLFDGKRVCNIDGVATIISATCGDYAKGWILNRDLTTTHCYVAKSGSFFAHGETLKEARAALQKKLFDGMTEEERIDAFIAAHKHGESYPHSDFFDWHHRLTGSCDMGRRQFAKEHGLSVESGSMTVDQFIALTENAYGAETIKKLKTKWFGG